jgi:hypothetical protein
VQRRLPDDLPLIEIDAVLIERVLCNLLENAAKYTPAGTHISIGAAVRESEVEVWVDDSGPGLPKGREESHFREVRTWRTRERDTGRRPWSGHLPRHRRSARRQDSCREPGWRRCTFRLFAAARHAADDRRRNRGSGRRRHALTDQPDDQHRRL